MVIISKQRYNLKANHNGGNIYLLQSTGDYQ